MASLKTRQLLIKARIRPKCTRGVTEVWQEKRPVLEHKRWCPCLGTSCWHLGHLYFSPFSCGGIHVSISGCLGKTFCIESRNHLLGLCHVSQHSFSFVEFTGVWGLDFKRGGLLIWLATMRQEPQVGGWWLSGDCSSIIPPLCCSRTGQQRNLSIARISEKVGLKSSG